MKTSHNPNNPQNEQTNSSNSEPIPSGLMEWLWKKWPWKEPVKKILAVLRWLLRWTSWLS